MKKIPFLPMVPFPDASPERGLPDRRSLSDLGARMLLRQYKPRIWRSVWPQAGFHFAHHVDKTEGHVVLVQARVLDGGTIVKIHDVSDNNGTWFKTKSLKTTDDDGNWLFSICEFPPSPKR